MLGLGFGGCWDWGWGMLGTGVWGRLGTDIWGMLGTGVLGEVGHALRFVRVFLAGGEVGGFGIVTITSLISIYQGKEFTYEILLLLSSNYITFITESLVLSRYYFLCIYLAIE